MRYNLTQLQNLPDIYVVLKLFGSNPVTNSLTLLIPSPETELTGKWELFLWESLKFETILLSVSISY